VIVVLQLVRVKLVRGAIAWALYLLGLILWKCGDSRSYLRCCTLSAAWQVPSGFVDATSAKGPWPLSEAEEIVAVSEAEGWDPRAIERWLT
jgi:hypothetical protein